MKPSPLETAGPTITLKYHPAREGADIEAAAFAEYLTATVRALRQAAEGIEERRVDVSYLITHISRNSPYTIGLTPMVRMVDAPIVRGAQERYIANIRALERGTIPDATDFAMLRTYQRLGAIMDRNRFSTDLTLNGATAEASANLKHKLDLELQKDQWSVGAIRGFIRSYHSAGSKRVIRLYPRAGSTVVARFRSKDQERVRGLIDMYVEAYGRQRYRPNAYEPYYMEVDAINAIDVGSAPTFSQMEGSIPKWGEERAPEDVIGEGRDGW